MKKNIVLIEAGHFYAGKPLDRLETEGPNPVLIQEVNLARALAESVRADGRGVEYSVLIDDTGSPEEGRGLVYARTMAQVAPELTRNGFVPDRYYSEFTMGGAAETLAVELLSRAEGKEGVRVASDGSKLYFRTPKGQHPVYIRRFRGDDALPSGEVLDLAIYRAKCDQVGYAVTILPDTERARFLQHRVRKLASLLGKPPPVVCVYHDTDGNITEIDDWLATPEPREF